METLTFLMTSTFFPPQNIGGADLHVKNLADELDKLGHEVHVLHSADAYRMKKGAYGSTSKQTVDEARESGVHTHVVETPLNLSAYVTYILGGFPAVTKEFEKLVNEIKPDVVHHHEVSLLGYRIMRKFGDYLNLHTAHDFWLICQHSTLFKQGKELCKKNGCFHCALSCKRPPQLWRYANDFRKSICEIDSLIAPSDYMRSRLLEEIRVPDVAVIPNFVPTPPRVISNGPHFSDFFLYVGRLERYKGILELIDLYRGLDSKLVVVGDGPLKNRVNALLKANSLGDRVAFLGYVDRGFMYQLLRDARALIMPSIWPENCPLIALEALSVGTPVVGARNGGLPEIVGKVDKSLVYDDAVELRRILLTYDKNKYQSCSVKAVYNEYYSAEAYTKRYFDLIERAIPARTVRS